MRQRDDGETEHEREKQKQEPLAHESAAAWVVSHGGDLFA
jgi:hypothetical protein